MNQRLKFSWGHIVAFLALIFIAYVCFMGITYYTLGNYIVAGIGSGVCVLLLVSTIIGAQVLKGVPMNYYKYIKRERVLVALSALAVLITFIPYNHFWSVLSREDVIVEQFTTAINSSKGLLDEYQDYAAVRQDSLKHRLDAQGLTEAQKKNRMDELQLLLMGGDVANMLAGADQWIDKTSDKPSVWNVFLFGNLDDIKEAISLWNNDLTKLTGKVLKSEDPSTKGFNAASASLSAAIEGLEGMKSQYRGTSWTNLLSIGSMILCVLMLYLPYFIQERNARNCERFWDFGGLSKNYNESDEGLIDGAPLEIKERKEKVRHAMKQPGSSAGDKGAPI